MVAIINKKEIGIWKLLMIVVVEIFCVTQLFYGLPDIAAIEGSSNVCRRTKGITADSVFPEYESILGIDEKGIVPLTQTIEGIDYKILLDTEHNEATVIRDAAKGVSAAVSKSWITDDGQTIVTEKRLDGQIEFAEWTKAETEEGATYAVLSYKANVTINEKGDSVVEIHEYDGGEKYEVAVYGGSTVYNNVNEGKQLLKIGDSSIGELKKRIIVESPDLNGGIFDVTVEGSEVANGYYKQRYTVTPTEKGTWKVRVEDSGNGEFVAEFECKEPVDPMHFVNGFFDSIIPDTLVINGEKSFCPSTAEDMGSLVVDGLDYWANVEAGTEGKVPVEPGAMNSRTVRNIARAIAGVMVGAYAAAHMPLSGAATNISELAVLGGHVALLFPMYVALNKFAVQAAVSLGTKPEAYNFESNEKVLENRFSDQGFNEGLGIFYTCKIEGSDWARAISSSIKGNILTPENIQGADIPQDIRQKIINGEMSPLEAAQMLNKNLYFVIVTDGDPSKDDFLQMVSLVHKLRSEYGQSVQILFSARKSGERPGFKPGAYQDAIGLFTRGTGPRTYEGKTYTDKFQYGSFAREQNSPIFGIYDPSFKQRALDYYKTRYNPTQADLVVFEYELKQLEETGWISGYYGGDSTILDIVQNRRIKHLFTLDAGNFIGVNQAVEMAAKVETALADPKFSDVVMFEPQMHVTNPDASLITNFFTSTQERFYWHDPATARIRQWSQSAGKVWIVADQYAAQAMKPGEELLDPWTVAHDWMESAVMKTVQLLGVHAYETRYVTFNKTEEVQDETYLVGMARFLKSNDMNLLRSVYARHSAYKYLMEKLGVDVKEIPLPDDPAMKQQALEIFNDASWFCRSNDIFGAFLGLTWTLGAVSSAFAQVHPLFATTLLATVIGGELLVLPQILAPTVYQKREGAENSLANPATSQELAAAELKDRIQQLIDEGGLENEDLGNNKGAWQKFLNTAPGTLAKNTMYALYDVVRSNLYLMPLLPVMVGMRRGSKAQIIRSGVINQKITDLMRQGYTSDAAISQVAAGIDDSFFLQLGIKPTVAVKNLLVKMLHYADINAGETYHITDSDVKKLISPGTIYRGYTPPKWLYRLYAYGASPAIGVTLAALPAVLGMGAFTLGLGAALGAPFALFPLMNYLNNRSARNMDYVHAIADVETDALGRSGSSALDVGNALFMAHREDHNHDYTGRVKWMIEKGGTVDSIWSKLTPLEKLYLREGFSNMRVDEIPSLNAEQLKEIDVRARQGLDEYLKAIRLELSKYRDVEGG